MTEQEILKHFFEDYQRLSFKDLLAKYDDDKYWDTLHFNKPLQYLKDNNLLNILVENDVSSNFYTALTKHGSKYKVSISDSEESWFNMLEDAASFKLEHLVNGIFSSLRRK